MEGFRSPATASSLGYESWEEVNVSSDKGRREVHYYLKKIDGGLDLVVVGKEKSLRHMSYYYNRSSLSLSMGKFPKLKSRREVIDWLNSIVTDSHHSVTPDLDMTTFQDVQLQYIGHYTKEFSWLGVPWTCKKRRKHYPSFCRNGVKISVHDFVYVLAEEDKRLVAYLEDMYEDSKGNKMVVVRWFHQTDEVGFVLPHNFNDREIYFSLCLQDLNVECIDGLATVLSPQHFEKFLKEAMDTKLDPFVCHKQFENDVVKPFDITQVKGYWKQDIIRCMFNVSHPKVQALCQQPDSDLKVESIANDSTGIRPRKRLRRFKDDDVIATTKETNGEAFVDMHNVHNRWVNYKTEVDKHGVKGEESASLLARNEAKQTPVKSLKVGTEVEVLSQDSGIKGCWFRASIIKVHKDKVKVRYHDIKDAADEADNLEEWILASRIADPDLLGIRVFGRNIVRPCSLLNKGSVSEVIDVGTAVDVWWHDAWWEGIVIQKESGDRVHVYFPGEKQESIFCCSDLRPSQEYLANQWLPIKDRPDVANSIPSLLKAKQVEGKCDHGKLVSIHDPSQFAKAEAVGSDSSLDSGSDKGKHLAVFPDLSKDDSLTWLRWKSSKKRKRAVGSLGHKTNHTNNGIKSSKEVSDSSVCERFMIPKTLKVDSENCKYMGDSLFSSAVVQPLTSLVMSR
uniref:BAH domain-containing protein n=3 Tax=Rhizophora mucronata TaxID=61149 RepID=A0A2P2JQZ8_RHIMU